jgi:hypothetical protein
LDLSESCLSIVLQIVACKEEEQKRAKFERGIDSKVCNCLQVLRELAAENMLLRQEVQDKKLVVTRLKKRCILQNAELGNRDKRVLCWLVVAICACIIALYAMYARF